MDYEKKYNEALEIARKAYNAIPPESRGARKIIEGAFPELRESEDERVRKALIEFLRESYSRGNAPEECAKWLVWLEQQKEQKPLPGFENADEGIPGKDFIPVEWVDACDRYGKWKIVRCDEQKPAEWSEEDEKMLKDLLWICDGLEQGYNDFFHKKGKYTEIRDWLKSLRPSWKPSEEQMEALKAVIDSPTQYQCIVSELKTLYDELKKL